MRGVLGNLAPVPACGRSLRCVACAVLWASWLLFTGVSARCVVLCVRCPRPLRACSPVCSLRALRCVRSVLDHLAPVQQRAHSACCVACAVSWATWLRFTGVHAWRVILCVRCPGPPGSCPALCMLAVWCCVCGVPGHLAPVHWCARSACAASSASWLGFCGVLARCVALCVACGVPWATWLLSLVRALGVLCCVCRASLRDPDSSI